MALWLKQEDGTLVNVTGDDSSGGGGDAGPHDHDDYLPLTGGSVTEPFEIITTKDMRLGCLTDNPKHPTEFTLVSSGLIELYAVNVKVSSYLEVTADLEVGGTINGNVAFNLSDDTDVVAVLDRAANGHDGVATTDVKALTVNEVVTALLLKVKELSAEINELKGA